MSRLDTLSNIEIFSLSVDGVSPSITIETSWWVIAIIAILLLAYFLWGRTKLKKLKAQWVYGEHTITLKSAFFNYETKIVRSWENLYIANRIYIELVTRKAAIPINEENDVIIEVYDSWYSLFKSIREEIKELPGEILVNTDQSNQLIELSIDILNKALRPHLTKYQARFRKWYSEQIEDESNRDRDPQEIQAEYSDFKELVESMKEVNEFLLNYSIELKKFIDNNSS